MNLFLTLEIIKTEILIKIHEDKVKNVTSWMFIRLCFPLSWQPSFVPILPSSIHPRDQKDIYLFTNIMVIECHLYSVHIVFHWSHWLVFWPSFNPVQEHSDQVTQRLGHNVKGLFFSLRPCLSWATFILVQEIIMTNITSQFKLRVDKKKGIKSVHKQKFWC